jgi:hypothetical protein
MFALSISAAVIGTVGLILVLTTMLSLMGVKEMSKLTIIQYGLPIGISLLVVAGILQTSNIIDDKLSE